MDKRHHFSSSKLLLFELHSNLKVISKFFSKFERENKKRVNIGIQKYLDLNGKFFQLNGNGNGNQLNFSGVSTPIRKLACSADD